MSSSGCGLLCMVDLGGNLVAKELTQSIGYWRVQLIRCSRRSYRPNQSRRSPLPSFEPLRSLEAVEHRHGEVGRR